MRNLIITYTKEALSKNNAAILFSCILLFLSELIIVFPVIFYKSLSLWDIFLTILLSSGFYATFFLVFSFLSYILTFAYRKVSNKNSFIYYLSLFIILIIFLTIPVYFYIKTFNYSFSLIDIVFIFSYFALFIMILRLRPGEFIDISKKYTRLSVFVPFIAAITLLTSGVIFFYSFDEILLYFLIIAFIFYYLAFLILIYFNIIRFYSHVSTKIVIIVAFILMLFSVIFISSNLKVEAIVKRNMPYTKTLIYYIAMIMDFDRDNSGPELFSGGGDINNTDSGINNLASEIPDNIIDENNLSGDLHFTPYPFQKANKKYAKPASIKNVMLITVEYFNNGKEIITNKSFLADLTRKAVVFSNVIPSTDDTISNLQKAISIKTGLIDNIRESKLPKENLFTLLQSNNINIFAYLDDTYPAISDKYKLLNNADVLVANNSYYLNPVKEVNSISDLGQGGTNPFFCWINFDSRLKLKLDNRIRNIFMSLNLFRKLDSTVIIVMFLPDRKNNVINNPGTILIINSALKPLNVNKLVSTIDLTPTILDIYGIKYKSAEYTGVSLLNRNITNRPYFYLSHNPLIATVLYNNFKLVYNIKYHYFELFNIIKDPEERINIINSNPEKLKELKKLLDLFIGTY